MDPQVKGLQTKVVDQAMDGLDTVSKAQETVWASGLAHPEVVGGNDPMAFGRQG
jgi:hypothetical protein